MIDEAVALGSADVSRILGALGAHDRRVLEVLAVIYSESTRTELARALVALRSKDPQGKAWNTARLEPVLERLRAAGALRVTGTIRCEPALRESLAIGLVDRGEFSSVCDAVEHAIPIAEDSAGRPLWRTPEQAVRPVRSALYRGDVTGTVVQWERSRSAPGIAPLAAIVHDPFAYPLLRRLPPPLLALLGREMIARGPHEFPALRRAFREHVAASPTLPKDPWLRCALANEQLWCGRVAEAVALLDGLSTVEAHRLRARALLLRGTPAEARKAYEFGVLEAPEATDDAMFYTTALLAVGDAHALREAQRYAVAVPGDYGTAASYLARVAVYLAQGTAPAFNAPAYPWRPVEPGDLRALFEALAHHWTRTAIPPHLATRLETLREASALAGHAWLESEACELLRGPNEQGPEHDDAGSASSPSGLVSLAALVRAPELWRAKLDALAALDVSAVKTESPDVRERIFEARLAWVLRVHDGRAIEIAPREQRRASHGWTGGRPVALQRLYGRLVDFPHATEQDRRVLSHLRQHTTRSFGYPDTSYTFEMEPALEALVGHPALYVAPSSVPVELRHGAPRLEVDTEEGAFAVRFDPPLRDTYALRVTDSGALELVRPDATQRRVAALLEGGLRIPSGEEKHLREVLEHLAKSVPVHSTLEGLGATAVSADATLRVQLAPYRAGLRVAVAVRPLGDGGPAFSPGAGASTVTAPRAGGVARAVRPLDDEQARLEAFVRACPSLARGAYDGTEWRIGDAATALELLSEVSAMGPLVVPEWPRGVPVWQITKPARRAFSLRLRAAGGQLEATGALELGPERSVDLAALLALVEASPGRFLELGDGRFAELTEAFAERLRTLRRVASTEGAAVRVHPLYAELLEGLAEEAEKAKLEKEVRALLGRRATAEAASAEVPSVLRAELRDYQTAGFRWLARLSGWATGACLADDMGVGKTVQVLALLTLRASEGPALVLAPTSVCGHWIEELRRFAPSLSARRFGPGDRDAALREAGPGTVFVVSYGIMQSDAARLTSVRWHTLVLDEAQQLKNSATQRFKAVEGLRADFCVACTGTPVENHLGDLWSIVRLACPGLLSTLAEFRRRFQEPIERDRSPLARAQLRQVLRPFVLRRTKSEVLGELPPRTEVTLAVELEPEEATLYELLRTRAVRSLEGAAGEGPGARMRILAQLTLLRQAACNARLVLDDGAQAPPSAKLAAFGDLVESLREGGHRALVFSQFVRHLALVRAWLDARRIAYQYLDGGSTAAQRDGSVRAFQAGEGELFLCSLRAGGTGLNLTAADFVIHLDPWWNPAVEDQASDRAHRMGQRRPVTVYRLVARGTLEEKILALHASKRELSMGLLEGDADDGALSLDELRALLDPA